MPPLPVRSSESDSARPASEKLALTWDDEMTVLGVKVLGTV